MPLENNFQHSKYSRTDPGDRTAWLEFEMGPHLDSEVWREAMGKAGSQLARADVRAVLFLSGMPYADPFGSERLDEAGGLKRGYSRGIPGLESLLGLLRADTNGLPKGGDYPRPPLANNEITKQRLDDLVGEVGNFSGRYVQGFASAMNGDPSTKLVCERYLWSSVNHHLGRVEAALCLIRFLQDWAEGLSLQAGHRILVQGHGHGGQILALVSNFIATTEASNRKAIFQILAGYYDRIEKNGDAIESLDRLYRLLTTQTFLNGAALDVVTLGTPVRYGWETSRVEKLLHFVNHRPIRGDAKRWLAKMELPQIAWEIPMLAGGDYIQQLAVAGTDAVPDTEEEQLVNRELGGILEPYDGFERWLECARRGTRCANDGQCLLVDYKVKADSPCTEHLYGHGCYTGMDVMMFNTLQVVKTIYPN
jgi:hypothetical protein